MTLFWTFTDWLPWCAALALFGPIAQHLWNTVVADLRHWEERQWDDEPVPPLFWTGLACFFVAALWLLYGMPGLDLWN